MSGMTFFDVIGGGTALLAVDLMERVVAQLCTPYPAQRVVGRTVRLANALRSVGGVVAWIRSERPGGVEQQQPGSGLVAEIQPSSADLTAVKSAWGAFHTTDLDRQLRARGVTTVWIAGIATNYGVESTARCADELGYRVVTVEDAMTGLQPGHHDVAVTTVLSRLGAVTSHDVLIDEMQARSHP